jgi:ADP-heptose:LPS heptosyltransferase
MSFLGHGNALAYRLRAEWQDRRDGRRAARAWRDPAPSASAGDAVLLVSNGLIGDAILSTSAWRHLRVLWPGKRLVLLGRAAIWPVAEPLFDRFVPFDPATWPAGAEQLGGTWEAIVGDTHVFNGGLGALRTLFERVPARTKLVYEGYAARARFAPCRRFPSGVEVVASLGDRGHVLDHERHYAEAIAARLGVAAPQGPWRPVLTPAHDEGLWSAHGIAPRHYVACQLTSNKPRKDYPLERFAEAIGALPGRRFVALGTAAERERVSGLRLPNVTNLCGTTTLAECFAIVAQATGFLGLDSGLAHAAVALGVPTAVVIGNNKLGWFWPWPQGLTEAPLAVVRDERLRACEGAFFACPTEPIWELARRGPRCLRSLPASRVAEAVAAL